MKKAVLLSTFFIIFAMQNTAHASYEIYGRWCDIWFPGSNEFYTVMTIREKSDGDWEVHRKHSDGSQGTSPLERDGKYFINTTSPTGDTYTIDTRSNGALRLTDRSGFLRSIRRLGNEPNDHDCP